jgi:hypothetical protein
MNSRQGCIAGSIFRLYVCGAAVLMWYLGFHEERSINAVIAQSSEGYWSLWILCIGGVVGLLDVVLNDYASAVKRPPLFTYARTHRHFGLALLAFAHTCIAFISVVKIGSPGAAVFSLWSAVFIIGFSLLDAHQRALDSQKEAVCRTAFN